MISVGKKVEAENKEEKRGSVERICKKLCVEKCSVKTEFESTPILVQLDPWPRLCSFIGSVCMCVLSTCVCVCDREMKSEREVEIE